jgi:hypothetical protein
MTSAPLWGIAQHSGKSEPMFRDNLSVLLIPEERRIHLNLSENLQSCGNISVSKELWRLQTRFDAEMVGSGNHILMCELQYEGEKT